MCDKVLHSAETFEYHMVDVHGKAVNAPRKPAVVMDTHPGNVQEDVSFGSFVANGKPRQPRRKSLSRRKRAPLPGLYNFSLRPKA